MSSSTQYEAPTGSWNLKIRIGGSYDLDGYRRAIAALYGLWLFVLVGVAIVTIFARRSRNGDLRVQKIWLPIGLAIVYYSFTFANQLVEISATEVTYAYVLVLTIFSSCLYLAEIALLAVVFRLLFQLLQRPGTGSRRHHGWLIVHYVFCGFLFLVYIALFGMKVRQLYDEVYVGDYTDYYVHGRPVWSILDVFYDALYALAALEVFIGAIMVFNHYRKYQLTSNLPRLAFILIAFPLLFSRLFTLGYNAAYELTWFDYELISATIAFIVISGLAKALIFAGLVAITRQAVNKNHHSDLEDRAMQQGHHAPSHAAMDNEPYSHEYGLRRSPSKERLVGPEGILAEGKNGVTNWRPNFRKGGKSGLGFKTGF